MIGQRAKGRKGGAGEGLPRGMPPRRKPTFSLSVCPRAWAEAQAHTPCDRRKITTEKIEEAEENEEVV